MQELRLEIIIGKCSEINNGQIYLELVDYVSNHNSRIESIDEHVLPHPWREWATYKRDAAYIDDLEARLIPHVTNAFNNASGLERSEDFYDQVLGGWLLCYLSYIYEQYLLASYAINRMGAIKFVIHSDCKPVACDLKSSSYRNYIYSQLISRLGGSVEARFSHKCPESHGSNWHRWRILQRKIIHKLKIKTNNFFDEIIRLLADAKSINVFYGVERMGFMDRYKFFKANDIIKLHLSMGKMEKIAPPKVELNTILNEFKPGNLFEDFIKHRLNKDWPEEILRLGAWVTLFEKKGGVCPNSIYTTGITYKGFLEKVWASNCRDRFGSRHIYIQHGGGHNPELDSIISWSMSKVYDEGLFFDHFFVCSGNIKRSFPYVFNDLAGKKTVPSKKIRDVLLVGNPPGRFQRYFASRPQPWNIDSYYNNLHLVAEFFVKWSQSKAKNTTIRYRVRSGDASNWGLFECASSLRDVKKEEPGVLLNGASDFIKSVEKSSLVVHFHNSTTFLQTLIINKPTIVILSQYDRIANCALPCYDRLKEVSILFDDIHSALSFLKNNIDYVYEWWNSNKTQAAVKAFLRYNADMDLHRYRIPR